MFCGVFGLFCYFFKKLIHWYTRDKKKKEREKLGVKVKLSL
jgi:hypothetical protein